MGLYRYVSSKNELLMLMVDTAWGPPPAGLTPGETWRQGLIRWARTQRDRLYAHPVDALDPRQLAAVVAQ